MKKQNSPQKPRGRNLVNKQRRAQKLTPDCSQVMSPSPRPGMKKQNSHPRPSRRMSQVGNQRCNKETRTEYFSGHVGRGKNLHEQVMNDKPSNQERTEAASHTNGHQ
ncbi:hypothetical protein [Arthrobacter sp. ISL-65]|uniref:hypothetical protein n=1 Tax=Arthrobacter sp. ISL-65 TaxID=2819112 RepID=UPI001BE592B8|nr:hypothetical protein [Arthrobacter sp. ISL-65]MBT2551340.1 hypothetical protein [Arthrobacter sp. ISL-65]